NRARRPALFGLPVEARPAHRPVHQHAQIDLSPHERGDVTGATRGRLRWVTGVSGILEVGAEPGNPGDFAHLNLKDRTLGTHRSHAVLERAVDAGEERHPVAAVTRGRLVLARGKSLLPPRATFLAEIERGGAGG